MKSLIESGPSSQGIPMYFDKLSAEDQHGYDKLRKEIAYSIAISGRSRFCKSFNIIVEMIEKYIIRNDSNDKQRSLVCGIVWMGEVLALNTRQLTTLIGKCKSSVNAGFQAIGFVTVPMETEAAVALAEIFPFLRGSFGLTRQWTLRRKTSTIQAAIKMEIQEPAAVLIPGYEIDFPQKAEAFEFVDIIDEDQWLSGDDILNTTFC